MIGPGSDKNRTKKIIPSIFTFCRTCADRTCCDIVLALREALRPVWRLVSTKTVPPKPNCRPSVTLSFAIVEASFPQLIAGGRLSLEVQRGCSLEVKNSLKVEVGFIHTLANHVCKCLSKGDDWSNFKPFEEKTFQYRLPPPQNSWSALPGQSS